MRDGPGWFEQEQAAAGIGGDDPPPEGLSRQREVITLIVVATQRQLESVLSSRCAVAGTRTATEFGEHRLDMVAEGDVRHSERDFC